MNCKLVTDSTFAKALRKQVGSDDVAFYTYFGNVIAGEDFTEAFKAWYKSKYNKVPNINAKSNKDLASAVIEYYAQSPHSVNSTTRIDKLTDDAITKGYSSNVARENGKRHAATIVLNEFNSIQNNGTIIRGNKLNHYKNVLKSSWNNAIFSIIANRHDADIKTVAKEFALVDDKLGYLEDKLGEIGITESNLLAVYKELNGSPEKATAYINEVFADPKLKYVVNEISDELKGDTNEELAADANADLNGTENGESEGGTNEDLDTSIVTLNNHIGTYTTFMSHVSPRIANYFNSLPVLASPDMINGEYDIDKSNEFGMASTMNSSACMSMIYNSGIFTNKTTMIDSIRRIGQNVRGFEAFVKVADDLEANPDFATEMFTVFGKAIMQKLETVVENDSAKTRISNERADKRSALLFDCRNDIKASAIDIDADFMLGKLSNLKTTIKSLTDNPNTITDADIETQTLNITRLVRQYYPSIQESAVKGYILNNTAKGSKVQAAKNIRSLINMVENAAKASEATKIAYISRQQLANQVIEENRNSNFAKAAGHWSDAQNTKLKEVYGIDYISTKQDAALANIVDALLPYSSVNTSLNSRNVYGNQSSDVINSSLITKLRNMLKANEAEVITDENGNTHTVIRNKQLEAYGEDLLRSNQYNYDHVLLEHIDENDNVERGIFRRNEDGTLQVTEYAKDMLDISLFNGASNIDNGSNILYSEMTTGDYFPTDFINFHTATIKDNPKFKVGTYFLRTPSDAPKTFCIRAPKYDTSELYILADEDAHNTNVDEIVNNYEHVDLETYNRYYKVSKPTERDTDAIINAIEHKGKLIVPSLQAVKQIEDGKSIAVMYEKGHKDKIYIFEGTLTKQENYTELADYKLLGVSSPTNNFEFSDNIKSAVTNYWSNKLKSSDVEINGIHYDKSALKLNREHPVFKMLRNQFRQEMIDAATAIDHYFETDANGKVKLNPKGENELIGSPKFKKGMTNDKGYKFYHLDSNGKVISPITENGVVVGYRAAGNVFNSNKFTLTVRNEDGNLETVNFMDDVFDNSLNNKTDDGKIHFFYGGSRVNNYLHTVKDANGKIVDVEFSPSQQATIDDCLEKFCDAYAQNCYERGSKYKQFIKGVAYTQESSNEFAFNNLLMHYAYDTLFEGNPKFYKNSQTVLKRAKEYQGSGVPYGICDYTENDITPIHNLDDSYLNNGVYSEVGSEIVTNAEGKKVRRKKLINTNVQDIVSNLCVPDDNGGLKVVKTEIKQRNKFKAVTVKNSTETNDVALANLSTYLQKIGVTKDQAESLLYGPIEVKNGKKVVDADGNYVRRGGFTDTKVNDAQSYITYEEWVRRIAARGQLQRYIPLIKKLNDPNSVLTADDIKMFVQVQKNFYYDLHYDDRYGVRVPRQIKNAEFVLVPRFVKGTQLEQVYNMMKEAGIDQLNTVETSKAANETILTLWDNNENISDEVAKNFVAEAKTYAQDYSYNNLYTQQETPQHMDASNKAGIQIMKKIIDNIPNSDTRKQEYFKLFGQNIFESYNNLMKEFGIELDDTGNIALNADGTLKTIDKTAFYDKFKDELMRRGMDKNMLDYVTLGNDGNPLMPSIMSNQLTTLESAVQSVFNSSITRQKLPGFHAAQVTNVGFKALKDTNITEVTYAKDLHYHPMKNGKPQGYIEVKLPLSYLGIDKNSAHYKNMSESEILKELEDEGLDMIIGYRIPTEGKQSACNMKIVGLLDDAQGSTIVVPNDWVSQTGSDFDIDSVYSINYETYKTRDGQVKKVKYINKDNAKDVTIYDYIKYIRDNSDVKVSGNVSETISKANEAITKQFDEIFKTLQTNEEEAFSKYIEALPEAARAIVIKGWKAIANARAKEFEGNKQDIYKAQLYSYVDNLEDFETKNKAFVEKNKELADAIAELKNSCIALYDYLTNQVDSIKESRNAKLKEILDIREKDLEITASQLGLLSYEQYKEAIVSNPELINNRKARNNGILSIMQNILMSDEALEENLSRSNFDKITEALNGVMNKDVKTERNGRSPYNVYDQIAYQEDAMSGAKLKAFSVTLDTFCSVCNTVQPILTHPIYIVYNKNQYKDKNFKEIKKRFGDITTEGYGIKHTMYGYSNDNRNMDDMILTSYSSQTTAYILDAIKEGAIPNVNDYTFAVFKTLANVGVDYKTSISFIMQPAIKRIVDAYNSNKSVYSNTSGNPIHAAIKEIAKDLGFEVDYKTPVMALINQINARYNKEFNKIFSQGEELKISLSNDELDKLPILAEKLIDRINDSSRPVEGIDVNQSLFDLGVVLSFAKLYRTADAIGNIARCCNPDRFGAKQTVFATNKVFDDIRDILYDVDGENSVEKESPLVTTNGQHILKAIYPGIENGVEGLMAEDGSDTSKYPTLYNFLKYSTATSTIVAKSVLETQNPAFVAVVNSLTNTFSGINPKMDEKTYVDFQKYVLTHYYNKVEAIAKPVIWSKEDNAFRIIDGNPNSERERIYGYNCPAAEDKVMDITTDDKGHSHVKVREINVSNLISPTQEDINEFARLSPAQKVQYIKSHYENAGYFDNIQVQLVNGTDRGYRAGSQTIEYISDNSEPNVVYNDFYKAFYNENPFIAMTALDVVKYAVQVEGLRMSSRGVSKTIDNSVFKGEFGREGLGFVQQVKELLYGEDIDTETVAENYLRSHPDSVNQIRSFYLSKANMNKYGLHNVEGTSFLRIGVNKTAEETDKAEAEFNSRCASVGIKTEHTFDNVYSTNKYLKVKSFGNPTRIYKIADLGDEIILYPLNRLNTNEDATFSVNDDNNTFPPKVVQERVLAQYTQSKLDNTWTNETLSKLAKEARDNKNDEEWYKRHKDLSRYDMPADFDINKVEALSPLVDRISAHLLSARRNETLYVTSLPLTKLITNTNQGFGSIQKIPVGRGKYQDVVINKVDTRKWDKHFLNKKVSEVERDARIDAIRTPEVRAIYRANKDLNSISTMYMVTPYVAPKVEDVDELYASLDESNLSGYDFARLRMNSTNDEISVNAVENLKVKGVYNNAASIKDNGLVATREMAKYARAKAKEFKTNFNQFVPILGVADTYYKITDPEVQQLIRDDNTLKDKYVHLINEASAFRDTFNQYSQFDYQSEDAEIRRYIDDIRESVDEVMKLPLDEASDLFNRNYVAKLSTNPLIKEQVIDVMDNYWKTYGSMWQFHDVQENGNPILQIILKDVMGDMDAKRKTAIRVRNAFRKHIKDIIAKAKADGIALSWNDIIDEHGYFVQDYSKQFIDKLNELQDIKNESARAEGRASINALRAKNEYDIFKAKHINQEARPEYYLAKAALEKEMLDKYPEAYSAYMDLYYQRMEVYKGITHDDFTEEDRNKLNEIQKKLANLISGGIYYDEAGEAHERPTRELGVTYTPEMEHTMRMYSKETQYALKNFMGDMKALNDKYYQYDPEYGFEDQLKVNLAIIASYEDRHNGIPTQPISVLETYPAYKEAKDWVRHNARFTTEVAFDPETNEPMTIGAKIVKAFETLSMNRSANRKAVTDILRAANEGKGIYDEHKVVDGRLMTDEERANLKATQQAGFRTKDLPEGSDRVLISCANPTGDIYNQAFYRGMSGKSSPKVDNKLYIATVTELNKHLENLYDDVTGTVRFDRLEDTAEGIAELEEIATLYSKLRGIKRMTESTATEESKQFIKDNVDFVKNEEAYLEQLNAANEKSAKFKEAIYKVLMETNDSGNPIINKEGKVIPNRMLYSYAKPKGEKGSAEYEKYVDHARSEAVSLIDSMYRKTKTIHYYEAQQDALDKARKDSSFSYDKWWHDNHVYNPYTRKYEALACWTTSELKDELFYGEDEMPTPEKPYKGKWIPSPNNRTKVIRDGNTEGVYIADNDMRNPNYKPNASLAENYVVGSQKGMYDNDVKLNSYAKEMRDYVTDMLKKTARVNSSQKYFRRGYAPTERKSEDMNTKEFIKEAGKLLGIDLSMKDAGKKEFYDEVSYASDITPKMPMTSDLVSKETVNVEIDDNLDDALNSERTINYNVPRPTEEEALKVWRDNMNKVKDHNRLISESLMNKDWDTVFSNYILKASNYNAVLDNKEMLYYLLSQLKRQQAYGRKYGLTGGLKIDTRRSTEDNNVYVSDVDENLIKQYSNLLNRLLWEQYKQPENAYTKFANGLQGFTSANYMMLNLRGGIANVTVGFQSIFGEAMAGEEFSAAGWGFGLKEWQKGIFSFIAGSGKETATSKQDAVVKFFDAVDYDEINGVVTEVGVRKKSKQLRDLGFSTQSSGEHLMQNGVLFAMLHEHKIVPIANDPKGIGYTYMNEKDYINYRQSALLDDILNEDQKRRFAEFKKGITADKGKVADYAWFRKDLLTDFVYLHCSDAQVKEFITKRKEQAKQAKEEFAKMNDMYSQLERGEDGYLKFKEGSDLAKLDEYPLNDKEQKVTKAMMLLGNFTEKVRKTNNKIHGVYNKTGRAFIERTWYGSLVMQYHKHLPMGLLKRYMTRGHWNEFRTSVDKGMIASCMDFLNLNLRKTAKDVGLSEDELNAVESVQVLLKNGLKFCANLKTTWNVMPEYERANIRRNLGDLLGVLGGLMLVIALKAIGDDDDDSIMYNLALYEADRLTSESFMYNPIGLTTETKTLMSTPLAAQSIVTDAGKVIYQIGGMIYQGEDFEPIYKSGRFAGESKISVYLQRRIPMWNGIRSVIDSPANNHYYKMGQTAASVVPTGDIADWLAGR